MAVSMDAEAALIPSGFDTPRGVAYVVSGNEDDAAAGVSPRKEAGISPREETGISPRKAFSIDDIVTDDTREGYVNVISVPQPKQVRRCCPNANLEPEDVDKYAALMIRNPFLECVLNSVGFQMSLEQFFNLYPDKKAKILPYIVMIGTITGAIGTGLGSYCIKNPRVLRDNKWDAVSVRFYWATRDSLFVFVGSLGIVIFIDLLIHPDVMHVTNAEFYGVLDLFPLAIAMGNIIWFTVSPLTKNAWFKKATYVIDAILDTFLFHSFYSLMLKNIFKTSLGFSELAGISFGLGTTVVRRIVPKRYDKIPFVTVLYLGFLGGLWGTVNSYFLTLPPVEDSDLYRDVCLVSICAMGVELLWSVGLLITDRYRFVTEYEGEITETQVLLSPEPRSDFKFEFKDVLLEQGPVEPDRKTALDSKESSAPKAGMPPVKPLIFSEALLASAAKTTSERKSAFQEPEAEPAPGPRNCNPCERITRFLKRCFC